MPSNVSENVLKNTPRSLDICVMNSVCWYAEDCDSFDTCDGRRISNAFINKADKFENKSIINENNLKIDSIIPMIKMIRRITSVSVSNTHGTSKMFHQIVHTKSYPTKDPCLKLFIISPRYMCIKNSFNNHVDYFKIRKDTPHEFHLTCIYLYHVRRSIPSPKQ